MCGQRCEQALTYLGSCPRSVPDLLCGQTGQDETGPLAWYSAVADPSNQTRVIAVEMCPQWEQWSSKLSGPGEQAYGSRMNKRVVPCLPRHRLPSHHGWSRHGLYARGTAREGCRSGRPACLSSAFIRPRTCRRDAFAAEPAYVITTLMRDTCHLHARRGHSPRSVLCLLLPYATPMPLKHWRNYARIATTHSLPSAA